MNNSYNISLTKKAEKFIKKQNRDTQKRIIKAIIELPDKITEYFAKGPRKIKKIIPNDDYTLTIVFDNKEIRLYDMSNNLFGVFEVIKDIEKFKEVFIDESGNIAWDIDKNVDSNIVWNNRIDICKDSAYMNSVPLEKKRPFQ